MSFGISVGDFIAAFELAAEVRRKWVDAPQEYASLRAEVRNVENILKTLVELVEQIGIGAQQKSDFGVAENNCTSVLRQADETASKYSSLQDDKRTWKGRVRRSWKRFRADPDDIRHLRDQLTATVTQLGAIQNNIEIDMIQEVSEDIDDLHLSDKQRKKTQIADWFAPSSFAEQQSDLLARRHAGTAIWFLQSPQYTDWRQSVNKTLFCPGIPGSGKTIIVATVVDDLRKHFSMQDNVLVAYFYCNFRRAPEQRLDQMLAILVRQLFQEKSNAPDAVDELYRKHNDRRTRPSTDELKVLLRLLVREYSRVFFLIDALDECANNDRFRDKLLDELLDLQAQPDSNVNLLCTSRYIPEITCRFQGALQIKISAQREDIEVYLDGHMLELCSAVRRNKKLQEDIKTKITDVVDGMFLLARLHFESLQDKMTQRAVQKALETLPQGPKALQKAYEEAMDRINQQREGFRQMAQKVLAWIFFAKEELSVEELQEAVTIEPGMNDIDRQSDLVDADEMISVCAGLVIIDQESEVVRLVHYTTQEFFEQTKDRWLPEGESLVAQGCIDYLCMEVLEAIPIFETHPLGFEYHALFRAYKLLEYVGKNWGFHASILEDTEQYIQEVLCNSKKHALVSQIALHSPYQSGYSWFPEPPYIENYKEMFGLLVCAYFNDTKAAHLLLEAGADVNQSISKPTLRTSLSWAAKLGWMNMTQLLLAQPGINVNLGAPFAQAASGGHQQIMKLLAAHPEVDVNLGDPLDAAALTNRKDVVELLLTLPDIEVDKSIAISTACIRGFQEMLELLIAHSDSNSDLGTPLAMAISTENQRAVELLLGHPNIDVNDGAPLRKAVRYGHKGIVELLLAHPDIDVTDRDLVPLAISEGYVDIAKILLTHPAVIKPDRSRPPRSLSWGPKTRRSPKADSGLDFDFD